MSVNNSNLLNKQQRLRKASDVFRPWLVSLFQYLHNHKREVRAAGITANFLVLYTKFELVPLKAIRQSSSLIEYSTIPQHSTFICSSICIYN